MVVGSKVPGELEVFRSNAHLGGNIQSYIGFIKVYYLDLVKLCRIHTLESYCASGINHDLIDINISI